MDTEYGRYSIVRKFKRAEFGGRLGGYSGGNYQFGQAVRLSEGGMLARFPVLYPVGSILELNFNLTREIFIIVRGEVKYVLGENPKRPGMISVGVEFVDLKPHFRLAIQSYVKVHGK